MRVFKATYRDRSGQQRKSAKWYVEFKDHMETTRRLPAFKDRRATEEFGRKLERLAVCRTSGMASDAELSRWIEGMPTDMCDRLSRIGVLDPQRAASSKPLAEHVDDFEHALRAKGNVARYVKDTVSQIRRILDGCRFIFLSDVSASRVERLLAQKRTGSEKMSIRTSNGYLQAFKSFFN